MVPETYMNIDKNFHQLCDKTVTLVGWFHTIFGQCIMHCVGKKVTWVQHGADSPKTSLWLSVFEIASYGECYHITSITNQFCVTHQKSESVELEFIIQVNAFKLGTDVGFNMLLNISSSSVFIIIAIFWRRFYVFINFAHWKSPLALFVDNFSRFIFKHGKEINCTEISHEFDYGVSASLNMRIMDHLMRRSIMAFLGSFFQVKAITCGPNVGLDMLLTKQLLLLIRYTRCTYNDPITRLQFFAELSIINAFLSYSGVSYDLISYPCILWC